MRRAVRSPSGRWLIVGFAALGLLWRVALAAYVYDAFRPGTPKAGDAELYLALADNLLAGRGYTNDPTPPHEPFVFRPPAYPIFLAAILAATGGSHAAVVVAQALLDLGTGVLLLFLARALWPERPERSLWVFALWSLCPAVGSLVGRLVAEVLATFLLTAGLLVLARAAGSADRSLRGRRPLIAALGGALLMLATLARPQLWPAVVLVPLLALGFRRPSSASIGVVIAGAMAGILVVEVPWVLRNQRAVGEPVLLARGLGELVLAMGVVGEPRGETMAEAEARLGAAGLELTRDPDARHRDRAKYLGFALARIREHPLRYLGISLRRAVLLWVTPRTAIYGVTFSRLQSTLRHPWSAEAAWRLLVTLVFGIYYLGILLLALVGAWSHRGDRALWAILAALPIGVTVTIMWLYLEARNVLPTYPAIVLAAALPLADRFAMRAEGRRRV